MRVKLKARSMTSCTRIQTYILFSLRMYNILSYNTCIKTVQDIILYVHHIVKNTTGIVTDKL